jgi:hypothetical protein
VTEHDPNLLNALGHHIFALEVAVERLAKATKKPIDPLFQSVLTEGKARLEKIPPDMLQDLLNQMLNPPGEAANPDGPQA